MNTRLFRAAALSLALAAGFSNTGCRPGGEVALAATSEVGSEKAIPVKNVPLSKHLFVESVSAQGNLNAKRFAMVAARIDGTITEFFVDEGDCVIAGKSKLFQTDKVKIERAVAVEEQNRAVAEAGRHEAEAQLSGIQAQYEKAKIDFERYSRLREQNAIAADAVERADAALKVAAAGLERANAGVAASKERQKQAEAALGVAKKTLSDSLVMAPIDGVVTLRICEPGEFAGAGKPVLRIVDPTLLEVSAFLPGESYGRIVSGETMARITVGGAQVGEFPVTYKSAEIQPTLRTFEIKCLIKDPPQGIAPGAIAEVSVGLVNRETLGVPSQAICRRADKDVVFVAENGVAKLVEVKRGLQTDGWTELLDTTLTEGTSIITMGQFLVNDGTAVTSQEAAPDVSKQEKI